MRGYRLFLDSFAALPDLTRKQQADTVTVLRALHRAGRFSVFEATENQTIASTMTWICQSNLVECDNSVGYPWTNVALTAEGLRFADLPAPSQPKVPA